MGSIRVGTLKPEDKAAVLNTARNLGLDPYEFGALIHQESGFRPNVWGGAGGAYRGLIQFGPGARQEVGLPSESMTIAQQLPYVEKYFQQRGYKPGMGIAKAYATVLGGNPNASLTSKDAFGTSVASSIPGFQKGGSLYSLAQKTLGDVTGVQPAATPTTSAPVDKQTGNTYNIILADEEPADAYKNFLFSYLPKLQGVTSKFDPILAVKAALNSAPNYFSENIS